MAKRNFPKRVSGETFAPETSLKVRIKKRPRGKSFERGNGFGSATRFKPGQSGNPSGRPRNAEIGKAVRARLSEVAHHDKHKRTYAELIADEWIAQGLQGNVAALSSLAERAEGRVPVASPGDGEQSPLAMLILSMNSRSAEIGPPENSTHQLEGADEDAVAGNGD